MDILNTLQTDKELHRNVLKFATMLTVSKAMSLEDKSFLTNTLAVLVGFTAYHIVIKNIKLPEMHPDLKNMAKTWLKVGTMKIVSQLYKGGKLTKDYLMDTVFTLVGFNVADVLVPRIKQVLPHQSELVEKIVTDVLVVGLSSVAKSLLTGQKVTQMLVKDMTFTLSGFILYDLIEELVC